MTTWRLRPGTSFCDLSPSRSAGNLERKRRRPSGNAAVFPMQGYKAKRQRCIPRPVIDAAAIGTVHESREAHLGKHGGYPGLSACPRCKWYRRGSEWLCSYGKFNRKMGLRNETVVWLAERPQRFGSEWGVGCTICAWFVNRSAGERDGEPSGSKPQRGNSKPQRGKASRCRLGIYSLLRGDRVQNLRDLCTGRSLRSGPRRREGTLA